MWRGSKHRPIRADNNSQYRLDVVSDFTEMPYAPESFDVIVFDPPHLPTASASKDSSLIWADRYGLTNIDPKRLRSGDNVVGMFAPFLFEAKRVLEYGGIVLAKLSDVIHNHRYQWQSHEFVYLSELVGMRAIDCMVKTTKSSGNLKSSKWQNVYHLRNAHSYWIVLRNATYEERKSPKDCLT